MYKNDKKEFYINLRTSVSIDNLSLMFGGGKLLTSAFGIGADVGLATNLGGIDKIDLRPNYALSTHFFISVKQKQINFRFSISSVDAKEFKPSITIGLLR